MDNKEYVQRREALVPRAAAFADKQVGPRPPKDKANDTEDRKWGFRWNKIFHGKMEELCKEAGLI